MPERTSLLAARWTLLGALATLLLTSVHHVYGAYAFGTPWRNHAAHVSAVASVVMLVAFVPLRRKPGTRAAAIAFGVLAIGTLLLPVLAIGLFEGGYNHVLKDVLYFAGIAPDTFRRLFPPPTYEVPDDVFFELTGVLQLPFGVFTGRHLSRLVRTYRTHPFQRRS